MVRKISCFHAGATAIVIASGVIGMSFRMDSMSSTVRRRSSSASSASGHRFSVGHRPRGERDEPFACQLLPEVLGGERDERRKEPDPDRAELVESRAAVAVPRATPAVPLEVGLDPEVRLLQGLPGLEVVERLRGPGNVGLEPARSQRSMSCGRRSAGSLISITVLWNRSICFLVESTSSFRQSKSCQGSALPIRNIRTVSAPNSCTASSSRKTLPLDDDILAPFNRPMPKTTMPFGSSLLAFEDRGVVEELEGEVVGDEVLCREPEIVRVPGQELLPHGIERSSSRAGPGTSSRGRCSRRPPG